MTVELEPETRHSWEWRTYEPRPWPSVPEPNLLVRWFDAYCDWLSAVHVRTVVAWGFLGGLLAAGTTYLILGGRT